MKTVCDKNKCCGCYGCVNVCNRNAIRISDSGRSFNAIIDADKCVNCGKCVNICQMNNEVDKKDGEFVLMHATAQRLWDNLQALNM